MQKKEEELAKNEELEIDEEKYDELNVTKNVRLESFIEVDGSYFKPCRANLETNIEHLSGRLSANYEERCKDDAVRKEFDKCSPTHFRRSRLPPSPKEMGDFGLTGYRSYVNKEDGFTLEGEYAMSKHVFHQVAFTQPKLSGSLNIYPYVKLSLRVRRKFKFHILQLGLPICLLTSFSFGTLFVEASVTVTDRLQVTLSMVATLASYTFVLQQAVPKTSYSTLLDVYVLSSLVVLTSVVVQNVWLGFTSEAYLDDADKANHEDEERAEWFAEHDYIQLWCRILFFAFWLGWHIIVAYILYREYEKAVRFVETESPNDDDDHKSPDDGRKRTLSRSSRQSRLRMQLVRRQSTGELIEGSDEWHADHNGKLGML